MVESKEARENKGTPKGTYLMSNEKNTTYMLLFECDLVAGYNFTIIDIKNGRVLQEGEELYNKVLAEHRAERNRGDEFTVSRVLGYH
jgi:hypothetical protein